MRRGLALGEGGLGELAQALGLGRLSAAAIGRAGAVNAALLATAVLALSDPELALRLDEWRENQSASVADYPVDGPL